MGIQLLSVYLGREEGGREPEIVFPAAVSESTGTCLGISNASANEMGGGWFSSAPGGLLSWQQASGRERVNHTLTTECQPDEN